MHCYQLIVVFVQVVEEFVSNCDCEAALCISCVSSCFQRLVSVS